MGAVWWVLGFVCAALVIGAVTLVVYLSVKESRARQHVLENGEPTVGWVVQANTALFEKGNMDYPALVLISPDPETADDEEFMTGLAERIMDLKGEEGDDEDEEFVSGLVTDERYREGKRDKLPKSFTGGRKVYLAHIWVVRDHLPRGKIDRSYVHCSVVWDEPGTMIVTRPHRKKGRRRDEE